MTLGGLYRLSVQGWIFALLFLMYVGSRYVLLFSYILLPILVQICSSILDRFLFLVLLIHTTSYPRVQLGSRMISPVCSSANAEEKKTKNNISCGALKQLASFHFIVLLVIMLDFMSQRQHIGTRRCNIKGCKALGSSRQT
ncbi:hypothetical protein F4809DRAFT_430670 [Biscogniauxia mediterranea]|nr:hypothetical protein F4809DRAFT_430670 [Biscogniauxia mediterranea]